ncbi:MAG TPA: hypothetical protein VKU77_22405 [Streptosporangiaceae bacterium]|nr:hypothetical protein [Streptosporangiaceae bacterium]
MDRPPRVTAQPVPITLDRDLVTDYRARHPLAAVTCHTSPASTAA